MIRKWYILLLVWLLTIGATAQRLSVEQAKERVKAFMAEHNAGSQRKVMTRAATVGKLQTVDIGATELFAFNVEGGGYVIASADERTPAVLGYGDNGCIEPDKMPENMKAWLQQYDKTIAALAADRTGKLKTRLPLSHNVDYMTVEPLLKTTWGQQEPYNIFCPEYQGMDEKSQGARAVTGCVATAMAQVLNYHQWPKESTTAIPAYEPSQKIEGYPAQYDALEPTTFDWDKMLPAYREYDPETGSLKNILGTQEEQEAVSKLMRYCGQAVKMIYSHNGSGALDYPIALVLPRQFGYDRKCRWLQHTSLSFQAWEDSIYNELKNRRPVIYSGDNDKEGHAFVCDGYAGEHYFHINWGWNGKYDGNFLLELMDYDPKDMEVGFENHQTIIMGIQPPTGDQSEEMRYALYMATGALSYFTYSNRIGLPYCYDSVDLPTALCQWALGTKNEDGTLTPVLIDSITSELFAGQYTSWTYGIEDDVERAGTKLKLLPMYRILDIEGDDWKLVASDQVFVWAEWDEEGYCRTYREKFDGSISVAQAPGYPTMRVGEPTMLRFTVENEGGDFWETLSMRAQYETVDQSYLAFDMKVPGRAGETTHIDVPYTPVDYGTFELYYQCSGFAYGNSDGKLWVERGRGENAVLGTRLMTYETPTGELKTKRCHFLREDGQVFIEGWSPFYESLVNLDLDLENGIIRVPRQNVFWQKTYYVYYNGVLASDATAEDESPLLMHIDEAGNITMDQPWYIFVADYPEQSVQAFNPKFYFINGVLHYFNLDIDESMINTSACVVQEGEVLKLVDFTRKEGVVQGKLFADGTFSIPKQQCGKDDKYGYEYIISGSEDENADEEIKGRFDATHLYFDTPFYVYKYKRDDETGELTYNGTDSYYTPSIELYDGSTLTVPGESSGIKALPNDDKQKRADVMYDLQGRRVNPKAAGKGIYIKGKKYILK